MLFLLEIKKKVALLHFAHLQGTKMSNNFTSFTDFKNKNCEAPNILIKFYSSVFCGYRSDIHDEQHQQDRCVQMFLLSDEEARGPEVSVTKNLRSHPGQLQPERFSPSEAQQSK